MEATVVGGTSATRVRWLGAAVVALATVASLAFSEGVLRALNLYRPPDEPIRSEQPEVYRPDSRVGYALWPSRTTTHRYPPDDGPIISLTSNSDGLRNGRELGEPDTRPRVLVVGDSFVFGLGVRAEDRLTEQLERIEPGWRVDNMGMTGWGLDLMIRAIEHLGREADPDVVVLCVYTDDLRRAHPYYAGIGYAFPKFDFTSGGLVSRPYEYPRFWERLRLVQAAYQLWKWRDRDWLELNRALLDRYLHLAQTMEFEPVVLFVPGRSETEGDRARRVFVTEWASARRVRYLDLTPAMQAAGAEQTFLPNNWHWSEGGHRIAAEQMRSIVGTALAEGHP